MTIKIDSSFLGRDLNYDETVVYDKNAIIPAFLIIYTI
jgi:hypothetical protein